MPRVLIVEDDADVREFMDLLVSSAGYTTATAADGAEALERMREQRPCVVLLDLQMPVVDGFQFRRRQLADPALAGVPVVCVTAAFDPDNISERMGVPCLSKPIDIPQVFDHIRTACAGGPGANMPKKDFSEVTRQLRHSAANVSDPVHGARRIANVNAVRTQIEAIARGDFAAALANADPAVELEIFAPPEFPWVRHAKGVDALRAAMEHNFSSVGNQTPAIHNVVTQEDTVVLFGEESGVIRGSGVAYRVQFVQRFTFADGRLVNVRIVAARAESQ